MEAVSRDYWRRDVTALEMDTGGSVTRYLRRARETCLRQESMATVRPWQGLRLLRALEARRVTVLETEIASHEWQCQALQDDLVVQLHAYPGLEAGARIEN
ncbi:hypothetical protein Tco_0308685 [Tanacetum coccineum]